ncbi:MAG: RNA-binding protein [Oceanicola sp.]|nr:RNA-binding protein [Oceanicola sp.]
MTRGGADKNRTAGPERKCLASGESQPTAGMIRFVVGPDDMIVPDILGKLPGHGLWVSAERDALTKVVKKGLFSRAARANVTVPGDLVVQLDAMLARRVIDLISMARKSGKAVTGYEKVKSWLDREEATVLIQARDGSERGKTKLSTPHYGSYIGWLTADELGMAFGRQTAIHAALGTGGLADRVVEEAIRLKSVRVGASGADHGGRGRRKGKELNER